MKVLNLIIKQKYFDAILSGRKVQEFREIRPTNAKKYIEHDAEGYAVLDEDENAVPLKYDAIRFFVGYNKDRDSALVEVTGAYVEFFIDNDGNSIIYEYKGDLYEAAQIVYNLGKILETSISEKSKKVVM